jgi:hypothetical protein
MCGDGLISHGPSLRGPVTGLVTRPTILMPNWAQQNRQIVGPTPRSARSSGRLLDARVSFQLQIADGFSKIPNLAWHPLPRDYEASSIHESLMDESCNGF